MNMITCCRARISPSILVWLFQYNTPLGDTREAGLELRSQSCDRLGFVLGHPSGKLKRPTLEWGPAHRPLSSSQTLVPFEKFGFSYSVGIGLRRRNGVDVQCCQLANPDAATNAPTIAAVGIVFTVLSALVVSLRLYVRSSIVKKISIGEFSSWGW
jgi:hypothetical protein